MWSHGSSGPWPPTCDLTWGRLDRDSWLRPRTAPSYRRVAGLVLRGVRGTSTVTVWPLPSRCSCTGSTRPADAAPTHTSSNAKMPRWHVKRARHRHWPQPTPAALVTILRIELNGIGANFAFGLAAGSRAGSASRSLGFGAHRERGAPSDRPGRSVVPSSRRFGAACADNVAHVLGHRGPRRDVRQQGCCGSRPGAAEGVRTLAMAPDLGHRGLRFVSGRSTANASRPADRTPAERDPEATIGRRWTQQLSPLPSATPDGGSCAERAGLARSSVAAGRGPADTSRWGRGKICKISGC